MREQQPPIGTGLLLRRAHRSLARVLKPHFAPYSVSVAGFNVLFILWHGTDVTQAELPKLVDIDKATLTPIIDALERERLIQRRQDPVDRRRNNLFLTPRGRELEGPLMTLATEAVAAALYGVAPEEVATMRRGLLAMLQNLDEPG
jgi:MarR family transcriptional regulator, organic hydroperoxide resistance regulator